MRQCLGRKKGNLLKRCKIKSPNYYCGHHTWQPLKQLFTIFTLVGGAWMGATELCESFGWPKPYTYFEKASGFDKSDTSINSFGVLNSEEVKTKLTRDTSGTKIGIINLKNIKNQEPNILNNLYSEHLNTLAKADTLDMLALDISVQYEGLLDTGIVSSIFKNYDFDVLVWGLFNDNCKVDEFCINYKVNPYLRTNLEGLVRNADRTTLNFTKGSVNDLLSGELSGDLNQILYTLCLAKLNRDRNDKGTLTLIEKCKAKGITNNSIDFLEAYALMYLGIEMQRCRKLYEGILSNSQGCETYRLASFSNLAEINSGRKDSIGYLTCAKSGVDLFYNCGMNDYFNLIVLMYQLGEASYINGKIESSLFNYAKGLRLIDSLNLAGHPVHSKMLLETSFIANEIGQHQLAYELSQKALKQIEINSDYLKAHKLDYLIQGANAARFANKKEEAYLLFVKAYRNERELLLLQSDIMKMLSFMCNHAHMVGNIELVSELKNDIERLKEQSEFNDDEMINYYRIKFIYFEMKGDSLKSYLNYKQAFSYASKVDDADLSAFYKVLIRKSGELGFLGDNVKFKKAFKKLQSESLF